MPAKSKQQQKFMGIVRAIQKGEAPAGKFSKSAQKAAKSMKKSSVRKYAKTKHDDLPKKIKENKDDEEKWSGIGYDSFESIKEKKNPKDVYDYLVYVRKYKPDLWNNLKKKKDIQKIMKKFESVNEGKANIYGIEYRKFGQPGTKFLKSSLKMVSHQGWEMHKKMTMAILKNAEKLRKQDKWSDYRVTINGAPYIGWAGGRMTKYPPPKLNESDLGLTYKKGKTVKVKHKTSGKSLVIIDKPNVRKEYEKIGYYAESVNERRQYRSGGQEMNFIVQQLVKLGNTKSDAIKMTRKHYNDVLKRYKEPWFVHPIKKAEIISSLSANESINEAPGKSGKDQYVGQARVKVEPYTYKNQKRDFHDVSMYRDHKKPYNYYLSIRLAHSNKVDMVVDTGTHIQSKAGKWAQGFIKRRMDGTGKERFE
jgi:hypothetical protein